MFRDPKEMADFMKSLTPQFKTNKNGYEIRTKILEMAKDQMAMEYSFKFQGWEQSQKQDDKTGEIVTSVSMPSIPGVAEILETAEKFYSFVEGNKMPSKSKEE